jgi:uncharacterized membrane protein
MDFLPPLNNNEYYTIRVHKNRQDAFNSGGGGSFFWIILMFFFLFVVFSNKDEEVTPKPANTERVSQTTSRK